MRKMLAFLLSALLMLSLVACGGESAESGADSTTPPISDPSSTGESDASATTTDGKGTTTTTEGDKTPSSSSNKTSVTTTTTTTATTVKVEKPFTGNSAILWDEQHSSYDQKAEALRQSILNAKDTVKPSTTGKTYYVSYKGNDSNDGLTPATAWRSTKRVGVNAAAIPQGSTILFERGGVYRGTMQVRSGMSIGAYGSGPKPQLYGSPQNYADESLWLKTNTENVWRLSVGSAMGDVGNIIFDHGVECSSPGKKLSGSKLAKDYDFYHDTTKGYIYLYMSKGNPAKQHESIELAPLGSVIAKYATGQKNIVIDNLCIKYCNFGISGSNYENITITNCEIGWIGGSMQNSTVRFGNGIELFNKVEGARIENNWIYQCYDAGYTNQGTDGSAENNITVRNNLIEYCNYNIEVFVSSSKGAKVTNTVYEKNILRFAGYGFGSYTRMGSDTSQVGHIRNSTNETASENFIIRDNVFDCSAYQLVNSGWCDGVKGPLFTGNTWIQHNGPSSFVAHTRKSSTDKSLYKLPAGDLKTMEESVAYIDKNATVIFETKK